MKTINLATQTIDGTENSFDPNIRFKSELAAMKNFYVVANIKTTGRNLKFDEIIEIAAILIDASRNISSVFSILARIASPLSDNVAEQTGITQAEINQDGRPLMEAVDAFLKFVKSYPIFLNDENHEALFLSRACIQNGKTFENQLYKVAAEFYDMEVDNSESIHFNSWIQHFGIVKIRRRAIDDANSTLALLFGIQKCSDKILDAKHFKNVDFNLPMKFEIATALIKQKFIVVDIEVTGIDPEVDEVMEFAAILVDTSGAIFSTFSMLVSINQPVPEFHLNNNCYTQEQIERDSSPVAVAMQGFIDFIGEFPVFVFDMEFDLPFYKKVEKQTGLQINNSIYDIKSMVQSLWPEMGNYSHSELGKHLNICQRGNSPIDCAKFFHAVLCSIRKNYSVL